MSMWIHEGILQMTKLHMNASLVIIIIIKIGVWTPFIFPFGIYWRSGISYMEQRAEDY